MRKLFLFLFAALMSVVMFAATVTWDSSKLPSSGSANSFSLDGVTLAGNSNMSIEWYERYFSGSGTFTTDLGNFTKIEITADNSDMIGEGWSGGTWTGNAASVSFDGNSFIYGYDSGVTFVFTIEPAAASEPEPEPEQQEESLLTTLTFGGSSTYSETTSGVVSVTATNVGSYNGTYGWTWGDPGSLSVTAEEGYTITKCVFRQNAKNPITDTEAPFEIHAGDWGYITEDQSWEMNGITSIEVYGYAAPEPEPQPAEDVNITPNADPENPTVYYSTFYDSANKYALPTGVEAYVATLDGANLLLSKIADAGQTIPGQCGDPQIERCFVHP